MELQVDDKQPDFVTMIFGIMILILLGLAAISYFTNPPAPAKAPTPIVRTLDYSPLVRTYPWEVTPLEFKFYEHPCVTANLK